MGFYKIEVKEPLVASFYFESSRVHFLGLSSPIQSGSNCMGKESTVQKVPYKKLTDFFKDVGLVIKAC